MAVRRILPAAERTRRSVGSTMMALGLLLLGWLVSWVISAGEVGGAAVFLLLIGAGVLAIGFRLAFRLSVVLDVDSDNRTANVVHHGSRSVAFPLDALGPLSVTMRQRVTGSGDEERTITEYIVNTAAHPRIDLFVEKTSGRARQRMEVLARAWRLPCQSYGGAIRAPETLDLPLHERLRNDRAAHTATPLSPEWGIRIESLSPGFAMVSTHRSWAPLQIGLVYLVLALVPIGGSVYFDLWSNLREGDPLAQILSGLMGVVIVSMLCFFMVGVRDTFFPGTVRITERGVSYRGARLGFEQIEEVTATVPIEIVGDRRMLRLAESFCPKAATDAVGHELQRLILEVGSS